MANAFSFRTNPHPNIMLFLGACTIPGKFKIVMEVLDGDLEHLLLEGEGKKMSLFQRLLMAKDAAEGMNRLHLSEPAIMHRYRSYVVFRRNRN